MIFKIDQELKFICQQISEENKSIEQWNEIESDDMFQNVKYVGGFDATEEEFCFSVYIECKEYWFQFSLEDAKGISKGFINEIEAYVADK